MLFGYFYFLLYTIGVVVLNNFVSKLKSFKKFYQIFFYYFIILLLCYFFFKYVKFDIFSSNYISWFDAIEICIVQNFGFVIIPFKHIKCLNTRGMATGSGNGDDNGEDSSTAGSKRKIDSVEDSNNTSSPTRIKLSESDFLDAEGKLHSHFPKVENLEDYKQIENLALSKIRMAMENKITALEAYKNDAVGLSASYRPSHDVKELVTHVKAIDYLQETEIEEWAQKEANSSTSTEPVLPNPTTEIQPNTQNLTQNTTNSETTTGTEPTTEGLPQNTTNSETTTGTEPTT